MRLRPRQSATRQAVASLLLILLTACFAFAQNQARTESDVGPPPQFAGELELEKGVAERLEAMLQPIVGPVVVVVDIQLSDLSVELQGFRYSRDQSLPGLPVTISEGVRKVGGEGWDYNEIQGIKIRVFVAEGMREYQLNQITELIPLWINLNYSRGDQIIVEKVPFVRPSLTMVDFLLSWKGIALIAAGVLLLALLITLILRFLTRPARIGGGGSLDVHARGGISGPITPMSMAQAISQLSEEKESKSHPESEVVPTAAQSVLTLPEGSLSVRLVREGDGSNRSLGPLARIRDMEVTELNVLLDGGSPSLVAVTLNLARPAVAAHLLGDMPQERRTLVLAAWKELDSLSTAEAQGYATELRDRLDRMKTSALTASGPGPLIDLINQAPESAGRAIFADLEKLDAELAGNVRKKVFFLEDLLNIDSASVKRVMMSLPRDQVALLVKDASEAVRKRILDSLSSRAANLVKEESAMIGSVPPEKSSIAKRSLMDALRRSQGA